MLKKIKGIVSEDRNFVISLVLFVCVFFVLNSLIYKEFESQVVPAGDPFTYTVGFF
jgi:hypothetical protein